MSDAFRHVYQTLCKGLLETTPINIGEWQSMDVSASQIHATHELLDVSVVQPIDHNLDVMRASVQPNLPWADQHFEERVGGQPVNPPPSHVNWPWARHNAQHQNGDAHFSHSYPERFWPRHAGNCHDGEEQVCPGQRGIRFPYGDLADVVSLLVRSPLTRQAYLPVWFPEDTGAVHRERVPCTLGYHFMIRDGKLDVRYYMRSCDIIRHFRDDVYMALRLGLWMINQVNTAHYVVEPDNWTPVLPGKLVMHISSLHAFAGDRLALERGTRG